MIAAASSDRARSAWGSGAANATNTANAKMKRFNLASDQRQATIERQELQAKINEAATLHLLDSDTAAPPDKAWVDRLAELNEAIPVRAAAIEKQEQRVSEAIAIESLPNLPLIEATLDIVAEIQGDGASEAAAKLAELAPIAAKIIAADQVRSALIGDRFAMPRGYAPPFRGLALIQALSEALPERLRPAELEQALLLDAAREISLPIIRYVTGDPQ